MSTIVRTSKFRHVYGQAFKKELCYDNLRITSDASASLIKVNTKYLAVNTGSNVMIIPLNKVGRNSMADGIKLEVPVEDKDFTGGAVVDMEFSRHDQEVIAVGFDDGIIRLFHVESFSHLVSLKGHSRKVTGLFFHPTVNGLLASISADLTLKLWDTVSGVEKISTCHPDVIYSFCFNYDGSLMATTCKDRTIRLFDTRSGSLRREKAELFESLKSSQLIWLGQSEYLVSTGFSRSSERQVKLVSSKDMSVVETLVLDTSPGILQPFYDSDIDILYISGRGDSHIHYYELANNKLHFLSSYKSTIPQRSIVFLPKVALDIAETEIARAYKLSCANCVEPISFRVPRKGDGFQEDLYPDTPGLKATLTCTEFFSSESSTMPLLISMKDHLQKKLQWDHTDLTKSTQVSSGKPPKSSTETTTSTSKQKDEDLKSAIVSLQKQNKELQSLLVSKESLILSLSQELNTLRQDEF